MGFRNGGYCAFYNLKVKDSFSNVVSHGPSIFSISISDSKGPHCPLTTLVLVG